MPEGIPRTVLQPSRGWAPFDLAELVRYRELLGFLTWRDVKVRYKQTALGALWAILQPLALMAVYTVLFGRLAKLPYEGTAYPVFCFAGLLPWLYFQNAVQNASGSLIQDARLITRVYFPRLYLPAAPTFAALLDYAIALVILGLVAAWYGVVPDAELLALLVIVPASVLAATGVGTLLGALNVEYRDVRYVIPFLLQLWFFVTPVIYPVTMVPERWRWLLYLNPMSGLVDAHRAAILPEKALDWGAFAISFASALAFFFFGTLYFRRVERSFADVI